MNTKKNIFTSIFISVTVTSVFFLSLLQFEKIKYRDELDEVKSDSYEFANRNINLERSLNEIKDTNEKSVVKMKTIEVSLLEMTDAYDKSVRQNVNLQNELDEMNTRWSDLQYKLQEYIIKSNKEVGLLTDKIDFNEQSRKSYFNDRYYFGINFPDEWIALDEPPARDGIALYNHKNYDIRVYGGYRVEPPNHPINYIEEDILRGYKNLQLVNNDGLIGTLLTKNDNDYTTLKYYVIGESRYCCFYTVMETDYFKDNQEIIYEIVMTLSLHED